MFKKKIVLLHIIFSATLCTSQLTTAEKEPAASNLIIINNALEHSFKEVETTEEFRPFGAMNIELLQALTEKKTAILTTKYLFYNVLFLQEIWKDITTLTADAFYDKHPKYDEFFTIYTKPLATQTNTIFELIKKLIDQGKDNDQIATEIMTLFAKDPSNSFFSNQKTFRLFISLLKNKIYLASISLDNYEYKEINNNFILLIPRAKTYNFPEFKNFTFDVKNIPTQISQQSNLIDMKQEFDPLLRCLGRELLNALNLLFPEKTSTYWNIYLTGHGSPETIIADIPSKPAPDETNSLFSTVLLFFKTNVLTKHLSIMSCYPGGKKFKTTFNIETEFNNPTLSTLPYTLLFIGALPTLTSLEQLQLPLPWFEENKYIDKKTLGLCINREKSSLTFKNYRPYIATFLEYIDQIPVDYVKASKSLNETNMTDYNMLIKLPNQDWMQPISFEKEVKQLSQTQLISRSQKKMTFSEDVKIIMLSTNYIPRSLAFTYRYSIPHFLPTTHLNYNFYFKNIFLLGDITDFIGQALIHLKESIEPMYFYIETFRDYKDKSYIFYVSDKSMEHQQGGLIEINNDEEKAIIYTITDRGTLSYISAYYDYEKAIQLRDNIINRAMNEQRLSINPEGIESIQKVLEQKIVKTKKQPPEEDEDDTLPTSNASVQVQQKPSIATNNQTISHHHSEIMLQNLSTMLNELKSKLT